MQDNQNKITKLYARVNDDMRAMGIAKNLKLLCSIELDTEKQNQVNITARLPITYKARKQLRISFDKHSKKCGFTMNYGNLPE